MPLSNYAELKASVKSWLDRDDDNIDLLVGDFIAMAEGELVHGLEVLQMEKTVSLNAVDGVVDLPSDYLGLCSVKFQGRPLNLGVPEHLAKLFVLGTGSPQHFSIEEMQIRLWPKADCELELKYYSNDKLPRLSDAQPTNWLLQLYPNLYLRAALAQGFDHFEDPEPMEKHGLWVQAQLAKLKSADVKRRIRGAGSFKK